MSRHDLEHQLPDRLRAAPAGRLLRAVPGGLSATSRRRGGGVGGALADPRARCSSTVIAPSTVGVDPHRARPGRGRLQPGARRVPARAARASATSTGSCSSPTRSSPATAGPAGCGRSSTPGSCRTSSCVAKAIANGLPLSAIVSSRELQERWGAAPTGRPTAATRWRARPGSRCSRRSATRDWSRTRSRAAPSCVAGPRSGSRPRTTGSATSAGRA